MLTVNNWYPKEMCYISTQEKEIGSYKNFNIFMFNNLPEVSSNRLPEKHRKIHKKTTVQEYHYLKKNSSIDVSLWNCEILYSNFFVKHLRSTSSEFSKISTNFRDLLAIARKFWNRFVFVKISGWKISDSKWYNLQT